MKGQYLHWFLLFTAIATTATSQQAPDAPRPATGAGFVKRKNKLYVYGGETYNGTGQVATGQFFVLDLSKQWKSVSPAWTRLPDGPPALNPTAVLSPDDKIFMYNGRRRFHFDSNAWQDFNSLFSTFPDVMASYPVTLGTDGTVLVAGGTFGSALTNQSYVIYSFATDSHVSTVYPARTARPLAGEYYPGAGYRAAWSESLKSAVFFSGTAAHMDQPQTQTAMFYQAQTKQWSWKATYNFQGASYLSCMASSEDGNSIFWYGGYAPVANNQNFLVLDLASSSWTSLPMNSGHRESAVCAVAGDYFLVWGGTYAGQNRLIVDADKASTPVSIYQISKKIWVPDYIPSAEYAAPSTPPPSTPSPSSPAQASPSNNTDESSDNNSPNIGAIAGGVAGVVVVCAIIGFLVWRRNRQGSKPTPSDDPLSSVDDDPHRPAMGNKQDEDIREAGWMPPTASWIATLNEPLSNDHTAPMHATTPEQHFAPRNVNVDYAQAYAMSQLHHAMTAGAPQYSGNQALSASSGHSPSLIESPFHSAPPHFPASSVPSSGLRASQPPRNPQIPQRPGSTAHFHTMYLNQVMSALLYTFIRLALQGSMIFLISHLALRTSNLTYKERINGGSLEAVKFLFFAKKSPGRQHTHGRIYLCLALAFSFALNYLATLLSYTYPVVSTYLPTNLIDFNVTTAFAKTTSLLPNDTSVERILFNMGVSVNGGLFNEYSSIPATRTLCTLARFQVSCPDEYIEFAVNTINSSLAFGPQTDNEEQIFPVLGMTPDGVEFEYFNGSDTTTSFMLQEMFVNAAQASSTDYSDMSLSSPRSIESCLSRSLGEHRCTRHSLGYLLSLNGHLFVITRRVFTMTHSMQLNQTFNETMPEFVDPSVNTTIDCRRFPTPTLETLCKRINTLGAPSTPRLYSTQMLSDDKHGRSHWDVVNTQVGSMFNADLGLDTLMLTMEAFHVDVGVEHYNTTVNYDEIDSANKINRMRLQGHEAFEVVHFVDNHEVDIYDRSWVDWGFSEEDIRNLTRFLTEGTMLNRGLIVMQTPKLLANVSNLVIILLFAASILMGGVGFWLSLTSDSESETPEPSSPEPAKQKVSEHEKV
ncbi:hypothetical protein DFQ27_001239 [Actinomortierella ambigua]|uniref:Kelch repeat protein n=1 Tax=Actinomortierella ambigua TaxID=1343610 RepID=A0A9P6UD40_9FUNG|nr:hypothetical protein DFQ27_001239 [Actinomortierella ambigua]